MSPTVTDTIIYYSFSSLYFKYAYTHREHISRKVICEDRSIMKWDWTKGSILQRFLSATCHILQETSDWKEKMWPYLGLSGICYYNIHKWIKYIHLTAWFSCNIMRVQQIQSPNITPPQHTLTGSLELLGLYQHYHAITFKESHIPLNLHESARSKSQFYLKILSSIIHILYNLQLLNFGNSKHTHPWKRLLNKKHLFNWNTLKYTPPLHLRQLGPALWTTLRDTDTITRRTENIGRKQ